MARTFAMERRQLPEIDPAREPLENIRSGLGEQSTTRTASLPQAAYRVMDSCMERRYTARTFYFLPLVHYAFQGLCHHGRT